MSENWQKQAVQFARNHNLEHDPGVYALDLMSELGEVAKELLLASDYGRTVPKVSPNLAAELGDVLYSLCMLATAVDVDLDSAFATTLQKYKQRWQTSHQIGSQLS